MLIDIQKVNDYGYRITQEWGNYRARLSMQQFVADPELIEKQHQMPRRRKNSRPLPLVEESDFNSRGFAAWRGI